MNLKKSNFKKFFRLLFFLLISITVVKILTNPTSIYAVPGQLNINLSSSSTNFPGGIWNTSGNVGIGTTNPGEKLEVGGNIYSNLDGFGLIVDAGGYKRVGFMKYAGLEGVIVHGNATPLRIGQVNQATVLGGTFTSQIFIDNSGNVGIGTTSPMTSLTVNGSIMSNRNSDGFNAGLLEIRSNTSGNVWQWAMRSADSDKLHLFGYFNGWVGPYLTVQNGGNVGVGTNNPAQKLSVSGTVESTTGGFKFPDGTTQTTAASGGSPTGMVAFFNLSACPSGWTDLTASWGGRYIIAKPSGGTLAGTTGTALYNLENRTVGQHSHTFTYDAGNYCGGSTTQVVVSTTDHCVGTYGTSTSGSVAGTNAPYVQLLICQKN